MEVVLLAVIAAGVWTCAGAIVVNLLWWSRQVEDAADEVLQPDTRLSGANGHEKTPLEPSWSPEGWGPPDTEIRLSDADEYLGRLRRPPQDDE